MNSKITTSILLLILLLFSGITLRQCRQNKELLKESQELSNYKSQVKYYKDKNGEIVAYNKSLELDITTLESQKKDLMQEIEDMKIKKPQVITNIVTRTKIDSIYIPFETKLPCDTFLQTFAYEDSSWVKILGEVSQDGVLINNITIEDSMLIVVGEKKNGLFKRNEIIVAIKNQNPHVSVTGIENFVIKPKRKFWQHPWFYGLVGFGGFVLGKTI